MKARVFVTLKDGVLDPQGKAIEGALKSLGVDGVDSVRQGKLFEVEVAAEDRISATEVLRGACEKLLANQVIENFQVELL
jgi:phosphoribosylformylglycinamidine synthase PurS subunit